MLETASPHSNSSAILHQVPSKWLLYEKQSSIHFTWISPFSLYNDLMKLVPLLFPLYRLRNGAYQDIISLAPGHIACK